MGSWKADISNEKSMRGPYHLLEWGKGVRRSEQTFLSARPCAGHLCMSPLSPYITRRDATLMFLALPTCEHIMRLHNEMLFLCPDLVHSFY